MQKDIINEVKIEIKQPSNCSEKEISDFSEKAKKGGKVKSEGLVNRIKNCELLAFCYYKEILVGISAIKKPNPKYIKDIIYKAKINRTVEDLPFEIGYSYTIPDFRRNGISRELKKELLKEMETRKGIIFSTTAIKSSQNFLEEHGFKKVGEPYDGKNDKGITYYERA